MVTTRNMVIWHYHSDICGEKIQSYGPSFSPSLTLFLHVVIELSSLSLFASSESMNNTRKKLTLI